MRIRTVKPEFYQSEAIGELPRELRFLAVGLLNWSDDDGYFRSHPALIAGAVFPFDADGQAFVSRGLAELQRVNFIELHEGGIGLITNFAHHQVINKKSKSKLKEKAGGILPAPVVLQKPSPPIPNLPANSRSTPVGLPGGSGTGKGNREREVEKEVEQGTAAKKRETDALRADFKSVTGEEYLWQGAKDGAAFGRLRGAASLEEIRARWRRGLQAPENLWASCRTVAQLAQKWNDLATQVSSKVVGGRVAETGQSDAFGRADEGPLRAVDMSL